MSRTPDHYYDIHIEVPGEKPVYVMWTDTGVKAKAFAAFIQSGKSKFGPLEKGEKVVVTRKE